MQDLGGCNADRSWSTCNSTVSLSAEPLLYWTLPFFLLLLLSPSSLGCIPDQDSSHTTHINKCWQCLRTVAASTPFVGLPSPTF